MRSALRPSARDVEIFARPLFGSRTDALPEYFDRKEKDFSCNEVIDLRRVLDSGLPQC
jgi:hypothetical protein